MSRAFVKEDDAEQLSNEELGVPPIEGPVLLTRSGFERLQRDLAAAQEEVGGLRDASSPEERLALSRSLRRLRLLEQQRAAARVVESRRDAESPERVAFGTRVTVRAENGRENTYTLVGAAEADPAHGLINFKSPLAAALLGHETGDTVTWSRPAGEATLTIEKIEYPSA